jgi:hypothetical protein
MFPRQRQAAYFSQHQTSQKPVYSTDTAVGNAQAQKLPKCDLPRHPCKCLPFTDRCFSVWAPPRKAAERARRACQGEWQDNMNKGASSSGALKLKLFWSQWNGTPGVSSCPLSPRALASARQKGTGSSQWCAYVDADGWDESVFKEFNPSQEMLKTLLWMNIATGEGCLWSHFGGSYIYEI